MDRLDKLIMKATPKETVIERLARDNPFMEKDFDELMDYMGEDYRAPAVGTPEWNKFIYAFICLYECNKLEEQAIESQEGEKEEVVAKSEISEYEVNGVDCMEAYKRLFRGDEDGSNQIKN